MMRLCCLSLSLKDAFAAKQLDDMKFIDFCAELKLDGVDINMRDFRSLDREHLKHLKKTCQARGLDIACIGINNNFGVAPSEQEGELKKVREGLEVAQFLGAPVVRLFAGYVRKGDSREAVFKRTVEGLKRASDYGEMMGVVIGVQNHNHNNITSSGEDLARLLKEVNHPWCLHILDTGQYVGSPGAGGEGTKEPARDEAYKSIERTAPLACFVRAKLYRLRSGKEAWLDYDRIFQILRKVKFNGWVCLVYEGWEDQPALHAVPTGATFLRSYLTAPHKG
jgi:sugar phosphate isomerase/epimerase